MWNYRVIRHDPEEVGLYEGYYTDDGDIFAHTEEPALVAESCGKLIESLNMMVSDVRKTMSGEHEELVLNEIEFANLKEDD